MALPPIFASLLTPPEPEPLPSLDLPNSATLPMAGSGSMPSAFPPMPTESGKLRGVDVIREIAPLIMTAIVGRKNPRRAAVIANGMVAGAMQARKEQQQAQAYQDEVKKLGVEFMRQTAADVLRLKDPLERQQYLQFAHDIGVQQFGLAPQWTKNVPAHNGKEDVFATLKGEIAEKLADFDKDKKWATVAGTPQEAKISFRLSNGQTVPVNKARALIGQAMYDADGAQAYAPETPTKPEKKAFQRVEAVVAGRRRFVNFDPATGKYFDPQNGAEVQASPLPEKASGNGAAPSGANAQLVQAILENPSIYDSLTPTKKTALANDLAAAGFGFGKPLSEAAIGKMAETKAAIASLRDLRTTLQENEQYIGPVAGLAALNPYSEARTAQAKIDLVKQRVGKALEGGVLRKEDEEKYKKILATLRDTPTTAVTKVDQLIESLERDLKSFEDEQRSAGRRVGGPTPKTDAAPSKATLRFNPATGKVEKK